LPFLSLIWNGESEIIAAGHVRRGSAHGHASLTLYRIAKHIVSVEMSKVGRLLVLWNRKGGQVWEICGKNLLLTCSDKWI
jgi:hypothetical protein